MSLNLYPLLILINIYENEMFKLCRKLIKKVLNI